MESNLVWIFWRDCSLNIIFFKSMINFHLVLKEWSHWVQLNMILFPLPFLKVHSVLSSWITQNATQILLHLVNVFILLFLNWKFWIQSLKIMKFKNMVDQFISTVIPMEVNFNFLIQQLWFHIFRKFSRRRRWCNISRLWIKSFVINCYNGKKQWNVWWWNLWFVDVGSL